MNTRLIKSSWLAAEKAAVIILSILMCYARGIAQDMEPRGYIRLR
jgi:hypothetical protein